MRISIQKPEIVLQIVRPGNAERISFTFIYEILAFSLKILYYKNPLLAWPNLGEAHASVLHLFCGAFK